VITLKNGMKQINNSDIAKINIANISHNHSKYCEIHFSHRVLRFLFKIISAITISYFNYKNILDIIQLI